MNLQERLRMMRPAGTPTAAPEAAPEVAPEVTPPHEQTDLAGIVPGCLITTAVGPAFCVENLYQAECMQGAIRMGAILQVPEQGWSRLLYTGAGAKCTFSAASAAFIDTETTGLERGAGTYTFLIGIGRFVGDTFRVRQFFMRDYNEEPAVLQAVLAELNGASGLVTFNGRSFDWPLIQTRATLNRLTLPQLPHLDLLYPARRLWRPVTQSCRLMQLEEEILGITRDGDIPGFMIPQLYFDFVRTGNAAPMAGVIEHNRMDILTTAALAGYLGYATADPLQAAPTGCPLPGSDLYGVGRMLLEKDILAEGIACLEEALRRDLPAQLGNDCRRRLGTVYRQVERHDHAVEIWQELTKEGGGSVFPYIELAKHYEHRVKDYTSALQWTRSAYEMLQRQRLLQGLGASSTANTDGRIDQEMAAVVHRQQRLELRLARQQAINEKTAN